MSQMPFVSFSDLYHAEATPEDMQVLLKRVAEGITDEDKRVSKNVHLIEALREDGQLTEEQLLALYFIDKQEDIKKLIEENLAVLLTENNSTDKVTQLLNDFIFLSSTRNNISSVAHSGYYDYVKRGAELQYIYFREGGRNAEIVKLLGGLGNVSYPLKEAEAFAQEVVEKEKNDEIKIYQDNVQAMQESRLSAQDHYVDLETIKQVLIRSDENDLYEQFAQRKLSFTKKYRRECPNLCEYLNHCQPSDLGDVTTWMQLLDMGDHVQDCREKLNSQLAGFGLWGYFKKTVMIPEDIFNDVVCRTKDEIHYIIERLMDKTLSDDSLAQALDLLVENAVVSVKEIAVFVQQAKFSHESILSVVQDWKQNNPQLTSEMVILQFRQGLAFQKSSDSLFWVNRWYFFINTITQFFYKAFGRPTNSLSELFKVHNIQINPKYLHPAVLKALQCESALAIPSQQDFRQVIMLRNILDKQRFFKDFNKIKPCNPASILNPIAHAMERIQGDAVELSDERDQRTGLNH